MFRKGDVVRDIATGRTGIVQHANPLTDRYEIQFDGAFRNEGRDGSQLTATPADVALSVITSADFGAYAAGQIDATQVRCALCETAPCECPEFGTPEYFALLDRRHNRS
ncbi:hypothetical protein [Actinomadura sp. 9N215]|uniref:hypothetical protein n=1 Tax=Actinomadura sp. 9N215 TaxID=3375150 RepID=UPI00378E7D7B